jgi:hypothetical protein
MPPLDVFQRRHSRLSWLSAGLTAGPASPFLISVPGGIRAMYYVIMTVLLLAAIGLFFFVKNKQ